MTTKSLVATQPLFTVFTLSEIISLKTFFLRCGGVFPHTRTTERWIYIQHIHSFKYRMTLGMVEGKNYVFKKHRRTDEWVCQWYNASAQQNTFFVRTPKRKTLLTKNCSPLEYSTSNLLIKFLDITQIKCAILFSGLSDESCNMYVYSKSLSQYVFLHSLSFIYFLAKDHLFSF